MKKQMLFVHGGGEGAHEEDKMMATRHPHGRVYVIGCDG
jgi:hypothetical protein